MEETRQLRLESVLVSCSLSPIDTAFQNRPKDRTLFLFKIRVRCVVDIKVQVYPGGVIRWLPYLFAALPGFTVGKTEAVSKIDRVLRQVVRVEVTGRTGVLYSLSSYTPREKDMCTVFAVRLTGG